MAATRSRDQQKMARFAEHPPYHLRFEHRSKHYLLTSEFVQPSWSLLRGVDAIAAVGIIAGAASTPGFDRQLRNAFPVELGHLAIPYAAGPVISGLIARNRLHMFDLDRPGTPPPATIQELKLDDARPADRSFYDKLVIIIQGIPDVPANEIEASARDAFFDLAKALITGGATKLAVRLAGVIASWVALHFIPGAGTATALLIDAGMISFLVYSLGFAALQLLDDFSAFIVAVNQARTPEDLKPLSRVCAKLVVKIGVTLLLTALTRSIAKKVAKSRAGDPAETKAPPKETKPPPVPGKSSIPPPPLQPTQLSPCASKAPGTPADLPATMERIGKGERYPHRNDGSTFRNNEGLLPVKPEGYYKEYVHPTPGVAGPGPQRVVIGEDGEAYYTPDHYDTFVPLN